MSTTADLSIIIPTWNSGAVLKRCLDSIAAQTVLPKEIWIIDGGSTDETRTVVAGAATAIAPRIKFISEKDKGIYDAMNKGIARAEGEWIYFLGSDDRLAGEKTLEEIFVDRRETVDAADFLYGNVFWGSTDKIYLGEFNLRKLYSRNICHQGIFYRKTLFDLLGKFETAYPMLADWKFNLRCFFDQRVRKKYVDAVIAFFSLEGSSGKNDDPFLREKEGFYFSLMKQLPGAARRAVMRQLYPHGAQYMPFWLRMTGRIRHFIKRKQHGNA